jgi:8-oxo-dGTP diphosphatase
MCHSTQKAAVGYHTPPKGGIDPGESAIDAAIRETHEEVGILVPPDRLSPTTSEIVYMSDKQRTRKSCRLYTYEISSLSEIGLDSEVLPGSMLQAGEIDWAGFLSRDQAVGLVNPHFMCLYD